jgi:hypothetical protein
MTIITLLAIAALLVAGCGSKQTADDPPQMANPASVNCIDKGGSLKMVEDGSGGQVGMCTLPDGVVCEEWAYMRGECPKADTPAACTMDAKVCPDGSAVGRVPPDCEFAPCPGE